jgi:hypothetical protein
MGVFEFDAFADGTRAVAQTLTEVDGLAVVGGGDCGAGQASSALGSLHGHTGAATAAFPDGVSDDSWPEAYTSGSSRSGDSTTLQMLPTTIMWLG